MLYNSSDAQDITLTNGVYEKKVVAQFEGVDLQTLYVRALEALSDWAGSAKNSSINIDVKDKEEGLVVYKGKLYMGYRRVNVSGWNTFANFTLKIKCKDGKSQLSVNVPSLTFIWVARPDVIETIPMTSLVPYTHKTKTAVKKTAIEYTQKVPEVFDLIIQSLIDRMKNADDDDF